MKKSFIDLFLLCSSQKYILNKIKFNIVKTFVFIFILLANDDDNSNTRICKWFIIKYTMFKTNNYDCMVLINIEFDNKLC